MTMAPDNHVVVIDAIDARRAPRPRLHLTPSHRALLTDAALAGQSRSAPLLSYRPVLLAVYALARAASAHDSTWRRDLDARDISLRALGRAARECVRAYAGEHTA